MQLLILGGALLIGALALGLACWLLIGVLLAEPSAVKTRLERIQRLPQSADESRPGSRVLIDLDGGPRSHFQPVLLRFSAGMWFMRLMQATRRLPELDRTIVTWFILPILLGVTLTLAGHTILPLGAALLLPLIKVVLLIMARNKRMEALLRQFPEALIILASAMRAGHTFPSALQMVVTETSYPLNEEIGRLSQDINLGLTLQESFAKLQASVGFLPDFQLFATAVILQRETGGNLAEVLDQLSLTIRERFKLQRQIASITAQPRMTGYLLGAAPVLLLVVLTVIFYSYIAPMYETSIGNIGLIVALVLQVMGFIVIRKLVDIRL